MPIFYAPGGQDSYPLFVHHSNEAWRKSGTLHVSTTAVRLALDPRAVTLPVAVGGVLTLNVLIL